MNQSGLVDINKTVFTQLLESLNPDRVFGFGSSHSTTFLTSGHKYNKKFSEKEKKWGNPSRTAPLDNHISLIVLFCNEFAGDCLTVTIYHGVYQHAFRNAVGSDADCLLSLRDTITVNLPAAHIRNHNHRPAVGNLRQFHRERLPFRQRIGIPRQHRPHLRRIHP